ncbi:MAG: LLM class flavin-dependent oxidoreductase [Hyphomicrobiales bacterium]|nr:LLM class flavin-dependent oxidoreductase [Hyphomicrobiales bacterium]
MGVGKHQIKLGMFLRPAAHHIAGWRHPDAWADGGLNFQRYVEMAQIAERGLFDMMFSADAVTADRYDPDSLSRTSYVAWIDPMSLLTALAPMTKNIGLVCTATTTYDEPFHIARRFASLDLISGGRAGWNLVTSANANEAQNFSRDAHLPKADRYRRAREFVEVVRGLWDSWDDDAFVFDKQDGRFFRPGSVHSLNHAGEFFRVRGPLNVARSPQGQPVVVQAGASDDGRQLAAETAEVVFTAHQKVETAREFYADVKSRMQACGRNPDHCKIMPGLGVVVAPTRQEALDKHEQLQGLIHPDVGIAMLSKYIAWDLRGMDPDGPVPVVPQDRGAPTRSALLSETARAEGLTIRQLYRRIAGTRGHFQVIGSPSDVADLMEEWIATGAADGFNIIPPFFPNSLNDFVDLVVPELQRRGVFRTSYEGKTLRENLGLPRPDSRYANVARETTAAE